MRSHRDNRARRRAPPQRRTANARSALPRWRWRQRRGRAPACRSGQLGQLQQRRRKRQDEQQRHRQPAEFFGVPPRDLIAHLAHDVIGLRVRRIERAHFSEMAEAGRGLCREGLVCRIDRRPVARLEQPSSRRRQLRSRRRPIARHIQRPSAGNSAARRRWRAPGPRRSARPADGARRGWSAAMRRSCRCTRA